MSHSIQHTQLTDQSVHAVAIYIMQLHSALQMKRFPLSLLCQVVSCALPIGTICDSYEGLFTARIRIRENVSRYSSRAAGPSFTQTLDPVGASVLKKVVVDIVGTACTIKSKPDGHSYNG